MTGKGRYHCRKHKCARKNAHGISREPGAVRELEKVMEGEGVFQARRAGEKVHKN